MYRLHIETLREAAEALGDERDIDIARRTGICQSTIGRVLAGQVKPSIPTLLRFKHTYGTSLDDLVEDAA